MFHREALKPVCARHGVDLSGLDVFLENHKTPLPLMTDTSWLGGKQLRLRGTAAGLDNLNTLRKGDADLRFYITTVQDG